MTTEAPIPVAESCGTCKFGHRMNLETCECRGLPPTPVIAGASPDLAGRMQANVQLLYAVLPVKTPACALYKYRPMLDLGALKTEGNG